MAWSYDFSGSSKCFQCFCVTFRIKSTFFKLTFKHSIMWHETVIQSIGVGKTQDLGVH